MNFKYGISNWIYGEEPLENQFERIKKFGYDAIEIRVNNIEDFNLSSVKRAIERFSLPCYSICPNMMYLEDITRRRNLIDKHVDVRENSMAYLKRCIELGNELEANVIILVPTGVFNVNDKWNSETKQLCSEAIWELGDHAKSLGSIILALEPLNRYENMFLRTCAQAKILLENINLSNVKMMLDFFHANIEEDKIANAIRKAGNDLVHCHVADSNRNSAGRGHINWLEIFLALRDIEYSGLIIGEFVASNSENFFNDDGRALSEADLYTKECIEYLKSVENMISK